MSVSWQGGMIGNQLGDEDAHSMQGELSYVC